MAPLPLPSSAPATGASAQPPPHPSTQQQRHRGAADTLALAVTRQAVAQAALAVGCKHTYPSVLDALTDLVRDYIVAVGTEAQAKAESGGRTRVTLLDVLAALEEPQQEAGRDRYELDWRALRGFAFRGDVTQLDRPEAFQWYQPFHTHIPPFPVRSSSSSSGANGSRKRALPIEGGEVNGSSGEDNGAAAAPSGDGGGVRPAYVPSFLPAFPPQHTFCKTGLKATSKTEDPVAIQKHRIATKQLILKAIARQKTASSSSSASSSKSSGGEENKDEREVAAAAAASSSPSSSHSAPQRLTRGRSKRSEEDEDAEDLFSSSAQESRPVATASEALASE